MTLIFPDNLSIPPFLQVNLLDEQRSLEGDDDGEAPSDEDLEEYDSDESNFSEPPLLSDASEDDLDENVDLVINEMASDVAKETIFLIGGRSRYGRSVRLNSKYL